MNYEVGELVWDKLQNRVCIIECVYYLPEVFKVCAPDLLYSGSFGIRTVNDIRKLTPLEQLL